MSEVSKINVNGISRPLKDAVAREMIENLPKPMVFKGTLGIGGTITELPEPTLQTIGHTYLVITEGTYAEKYARVGDMFVCDEAPEWVLIVGGTSVSVSRDGTSANSVRYITIDGQESKLDIDRKDFVGYVSNLTSLAGTTEFIAVSGNKNITTTAQTDVASYSTATVSDSDLVASNIKTGVNILGINGTYTSDGTLVANAIRSGYTGYSKGTKYTGTMANYTGSYQIVPGTSTTTLQTSGKYVNSNIYCNGESNLLAGNIKAGITIFGVVGTYSGGGQTEINPVFSGFIRTGSPQEQQSASLSFTNSAGWAQVTDIIIKFYSSMSASNFCQYLLKKVSSAWIKYIESGDASVSSQSTVIVNINGTLLTIDESAYSDYGWGLHNFTLPYTGFSDLPTFNQSSANKAIEFTASGSGTTTGASSLYGISLSEVNGPANPNWSSVIICDNGSTSFSTTYTLSYNSGPSSLQGYYCDDLISDYCPQDGPYQSRLRYLTNANDYSSMSSIEPSNTYIVYSKGQNTYVCVARYNFASGTNITIQNVYLDGVALTEETIITDNGEEPGWNVPVSENLNLTIETTQSEYETYGNCMFTTAA